MVFAADEIVFWEVMLALGAVVLLVVIALLSLLLSFVRNIEASVVRVGDVARGVAGNTANIKIALTVADSLDEVVDEAGRHAQLLGVGAP
ncbi:MAG: hypothetical protein DLM60_12005 [Pseudonocardiales bacterium]|nr:hypothetical protein [Actinomycetota bacterium]PZS18383.1 MAG: hypothetical protein DLM60_12005 [Pseudonocardiales bacterium]